MNAKEEIESYINTNEQSGALLLTGKWGCGKTFMLKKLAVEFNKENKYAVVVISLFGLNSASEINNKIKEKISLLNNYMNANYQNSIKCFKDKAKILTAKMKETIELANKINTVLSVNIYDFIEVKQKIKIHNIDNKWIEKKLVLIFDDFERCPIELQTILGIINDYTESRAIKTVIVADESKINDDKYKDFKEKTISRTIKLTSDYSSIIDEMISSYNETENGYKIFLQKNRCIIKSVFDSSECENLRTVKSMMVDFERVFHSFSETSLNEKDECDLFYQFCVGLAENKMGNYSYENINNCSELFNKISNQPDKSIKDKYIEDTFTSIPNTLQRWIINGDWSEEEFIKEINYKFCKTELLDDQKFLHYSFWELNQEIIEKGLPIVLGRAYDGDLNCDELITLLQKLHFLNRYTYELPCVIEYKKIEKAFDKRMNKIRLGKIVEPQRRTFAENNKIDQDAISLNKKIEKIERKKYIWSEYHKFIEYLNGDDKISIYDIRLKHMDVFDDYLYDLVVNTLKKRDNGVKRELGRILLNLIYTDTSYSSTDDISVSVNNLTKLSTTIDELLTIESDKMTKIVLVEFKTGLDSLVSEICSTNDISKS